MLKRFDIKFLVRNDDGVEELQKYLNKYDFFHNSPKTVSIDSFSMDVYSEELCVSFGGLLECKFFEGCPQSWECPGEDPYIDFVTESEFTEYFEEVVGKSNIKGCTISVEESEYPTEEELWPEEREE